jgi:hypothetical protein
MKKQFIVFETKADCQQRCNELTVAYNLLNLEAETIYAEPLRGLLGWYIPIIDYCSQLFTADELANAVDYEPLVEPEEETYEV